MSRRARSPRPAANHGRASRKADSTRAGFRFTVPRARSRMRDRARPSGCSAAQDLDGDVRDLGRGAAHPHALGFERLGLALRRAGGARHDRAGVAHRLARRRREARDVADDRPFLLPGAARNPGSKPPAVFYTGSVLFAAPPPSAAPPISPLITISSVSG